MKRGVTFALGAAIAMQFLLLVGMYVQAQIPLWNGEPIRVKTIPVDPRSLFRGNYARLNYDFSRVKASDLTGSKRLREGEVVYVSLKKSTTGLYVYSAASLKKPTEGVFLKGRIASGNRWRNEQAYRIKYGIEAYFAPKEKALQLERELRDSGIAELMVAPSGQVRLRNVVGHD
ncbi:GDYXXLXY domain-containing protein [uncultured Microbulbifer sp.]|uniref:GDYXXLXY domain-containing protein n=1 Tax=uncultured Microbulbifer sp. TaxID=348147 RepID=UPI0026019B45|nr:GDYXXLXY domain-containing protein [uncultured Microbulbifer sp.]